MTVLLVISLQHANGENAWTGIDGNSGEIADMKELKVHTRLLFHHSPLLDDNLFIYILLYLD